MSRRFFFLCMALVLALLACFAYPRPVRPTLGQLSATPVLILDAGHGGEDGGAAASDGTKESLLNLQITLRLEALSALCGRKAYLIRRDDRSVYDDGCRTIAEKKRSDLRNRVAMVNSQPGALLLSIHLNHFPDGKYSGAQVFYGAVGNSRELAEEIQSSLRAAVDPKNRRKCKPSEGIYLMKNIRNPGVLVECGFLSNLREAELLRQENYQKKLAAAILAPIIRNGSDTNGEIETGLFLQRLRQ
ncbi:MAG: N-acetylmuramoyl-L-alanine amidase [Oscillospiraceae bacterium]|nr:N-acetylmuramoyl-L-alanine amidase [Oscillospiraceae bacterium]